MRRGVVLAEIATNKSQRVRYTHIRKEWNWILLHNVQSSPVCIVHIDQFISFIHNNHFGLYVVPNTADEFKVNNRCIPRRPDFRMIGFE